MKNTFNEQRLNKFGNFDCNTHFHCNCSFISMTFIFLSQSYISFMLIHLKNMFLSIKIKNMKLHFVVKWIWLPHFSLQTETFYLQIAYYCYYHTVCIKYQLRLFEMPSSNFMDYCKIRQLFIIIIVIIVVLAENVKATFCVSMHKYRESDIVRERERSLCATCLNDFDRTYEPNGTEFPIYSNCDFTLRSSEMTHEPASQSVSQPTKHSHSASHAYIFDSNRSDDMYHIEAYECTYCICCCCCFMCVVFLFPFIIVVACHVLVCVSLFVFVRNFFSRRKQIQSILSLCNYVVRLSTKLAYH